jgi:hypothetical protein
MFDFETDKSGVANFVESCKVGSKGFCGCCEVDAKEDVTALPTSEAGQGTSDWTELRVRSSSLHWK